MLANYTRYLRDTQRIEYQKRFDEVTHLPIPKTRVKVRILGKEYNYFQDMRKFFKGEWGKVTSYKLFIQNTFTQQFENLHDWHIKQCPYGIILPLHSGHTYPRLLHYEDKEYTRHRH